MRLEAKARFVVESALEADVRIAIVGRADDPWVFAWAPTAPTVLKQLACERSFKRAVYQNLPLVAPIAAEPGGAA